MISIPRSFLRDERLPYLAIDYGMKRTEALGIVATLIGEATSAKRAVVSRRDIEAWTENVADGKRLIRSLIETGYIRQVEEHQYLIVDAELLVEQAEVRRRASAVALRKRWGKRK